MCEIAIGSDTGGSTRIPAALCGITGFKPSRLRVSTEGAFPLSYTLDSIGPMAKSVVDCFNADAVLAGETPSALEAMPLAGLRLGVAQGLPLENLDDTVGRRFPEALDRLERAGARLTYEKMPLLDDMMKALSRSSILMAEAYAIHKERLARRGDAIDQIVRARLDRGAGIAAADFIDAVRDRAALIHAMDARLADLDALVLPTTPIVAPRLDEVATPKDFMARNAMVLRNTTIANYFDLTAISLPLPRDGGLPTGLMLFARNGHDRRLFRIAAAVEKVFA